MSEFFYDLGAVMLILFLVLFAVFVTLSLFGGLVVSALSKDASALLGYGAALFVWASLLITLGSR